MRNAIRQVSLGLRSAAIVCGSIAVTATPVTALQVSCPTCRIELERVATLGQFGDSVLFAGLPQVQEDGSGGFLVVAVPTYPDRILRYDRAGRLLETIGRAGDGPGEFRLIIGVEVGQGDSIFVADYFRRITVLTPSGQLVRTFRLPAAPRELSELSGGQLAVAGMSYTPEHIGYPVQLLDRTTGAAVAMGAVNPTVPLDRRSADDLRLTAAADGTFWSGHTTAYILERWSLTGERLQRIAPELEWFPPRGRGPRQALDHADQPTRPLPWLSGIAAEDDILWVAIATAARDWSEALARSRDDATRNGTHDGVIHALDAHSGGILAELRMAERPSGMTSTGLLVTLREVPPGLIVIDLWRPRLIRGPQP